MNITQASYELAEKELAKLREFKAYVHQRLDAMGVPVNPDGPHGKEGCRVGDRLDWIEARKSTSEKDRLVAMLERAGVGHGFRRDHQPPGETVMVQIENEDESDVWHEVEFFFDDSGRLIKTACYEGVEG